MKNVRTLVTDIFFMRYIVSSILIFVLIGFGNHCRAQLIDSIAESFKHKPSLYANYGSNYAFITNQFAGVTNIKLGVDFNTTTKIGIGYNWIRKGMNRQKPVTGALGTTLFMRYVSVFFEYTYFKTYHWEASIPAQIGVGNMYYINTSSDGIVQTAPRWYVLYEPITTIQYRFFRYFAAGGGIGYRIVLPNKPMPEDHFSSVLFVIKSRFYFGDVYRDIRKHRKERSK